MDCRISVPYKKEVGGRLDTGHNLQDRGGCGFIPELAGFSLTARPADLFPYRNFPANREYRAQECSRAGRAQERPLAPTLFQGFHSMNRRSLTLAVASVFAVPLAALAEGGNVQIYSTINV